MTPQYQHWIFIATLVALCTKYVGATGLPIQETTQVFFLSFKDQFFKNGDLSNKTNVQYRASLESMPDLPEWLQYVNAKDGDGYLYGVPDQPGKLQIEVIATNRENYDTYQKVETLVVREKERKAKYEAEIWFSNLNVDDMFQERRLERVKAIFSSFLWKNEDIYVTLVASAIKMGGRLPANPRDKEGVVVRIGGGSNFSAELWNLELEVIPLRFRVPCPKDYKRTSAERFFREDHFIPDWCGFHLRPVHAQLKEDSSPVHSPIHLTSDEFRPPSLLEPPRDLMLDFILSIVVPITVAITLLIALSFFMCCYHEGIEKRNKENSSIQMVQYASIHRATNNLRCLATKTQSPKSYDNTPGSTLHRSYGNTPNNTLSKNTLTKKRDEKGSARPNLPPLYMPSNTQPK